MSLALNFMPALLLAEYLLISYREDMLSFESKALFLDRDGIIIEDAGYTKDPKLVKLIPSIVPLIQTAKSKGYLIIIVTNQSGIGRGIISLNNYKEVTHRMLKLLEQRDALSVDQIHFAPYFEHAPQPVLPYETPYFIENSWGIPHYGVWSETWRKPNLGMITHAMNQLKINLSKSLIVGDKWTDQLLAVNSDLKYGAWFCNSADSFKENSEFLSRQGEVAQKIQIVHDLTSVINLLD
jgi:D-glycero-D-manno-heptose 1,7-bisphosphate phosphatase